MICGYDIFAGQKVSKFFQDNDDLRLRQFCRRKILFGKFQDNDDLRLRQLCRQKSL